MVLKQYIFALKGEEKIQLGEWTSYFHLANWMLCRELRKLTSLSSLSREDLLSLKEETEGHEKTKDENLKRLILVIKTTEKRLNEGYTIEYTHCWE